MNETVERRLLTPEQAAQRLNVSRAYLYPLLMAEPPIIRSIKLGKRRLVPVEAVEDFIAAELARQAGEGTSPVTETEGAGRDPQRLQGIAR